MSNQLRNSTRRQPAEPLSDRFAPVEATACWTPGCHGSTSDINMTVDGTHMTLRVCGECGARLWLREFEPVELGVILDDLVQSRPRYQRL